MSKVIGYKIEPTVQHETSKSNSRPFRLDMIVIGNDGVEKVISSNHSYTTIKGAEAAGKKRVARNSIWL